MVKKSTKVFEQIYLYFFLAILYTPILVIIAYSFSNSSSFNFSKGFSFGAYKAIFTGDKSPQLWQAIGNTFLIAFSSSIIATLIGVLSAIGIFALPKKIRNMVENVNQFPIINSEIVMAVSLMVFFTTFAFPEGYLRLILAHVTFCTPYVILSILPKLDTLDSNIYEAALDLGATPATAISKVIIPAIGPNIGSGFILAFVLSMDDFIITQINKGATTGIHTLSTYIYSDAKVQGLEPFWYSIFSIIFILMIATLLTYHLIRMKKERKRRLALWKDCP